LMPAAREFLKLITEMKRDSSLTLDLKIQKI
jgi:hypothetical protein